MEAKGFSVQALMSMAHSPVRNYAIPGLTSFLIGAPSQEGTVRLFACDREHQEPITPHSHRFDFQCWVLRGCVRNRIWKATHHHDTEGDRFHMTKLIYGGDMGVYTKEPQGVNTYKYVDNVFEAGECYSMKSHEVHSIYFSRGTLVLFFEGPAKANSSVILEPYVDGEVVPTFKVEPWMFKKQAKEAA
jgi:hypothetical protein